MASNDCEVSIGSQFQPESLSPFPLTLVFRLPERNRAYKFLRKSSLTKLVNISLGFITGDELSESLGTRILNTARLFSKMTIFPRMPHQQCQSFHNTGIVNICNTRAEFLVKKKSTRNLLLISPCLFLHFPI